MQRDQGFSSIFLGGISLIKPKLQLHLQFTYDQTYKHMHIDMMKCV
jgi:hypothetical protein